MVERAFVRGGRNWRHCESMWNTTQVALLESLIRGTEKFDNFYRYDIGLHGLLQFNATCTDHREVLGLRVPMAPGDLSKVDAACQFVFREFGKLIFPKDVGAVHEPRSMLDSKLDLFTRADLDYPLELHTAWKAHEQKTETIQKRVIDCLIITALPIEFRAVVRRLESFLIGTMPNTTRGFSDALEGEKPPGWVKGCLTDGKRTASVIVACGRRYGSVEAANTVNEAFKVGKPRYVIVVGIAASLGEGNKLALGDIGYSSEVVDITLGKDELDRAVETPFRTTGQPDPSKIPDNLKQWVRWAPDGTCVFSGMLSEKDAQKLKLAWQSAIDRAAIDLLAIATRGTAEKTGLKSKAITLPLPDSAAKIKLDVMLKKAAAVTKRGTWSDRVHLLRPDGQTRFPKVVPAQVLSGSRVVKQDGMRSYLKETFPEALLVEMEAAGVGSACRSEWPPFVVKSACDWATPEKEKSWQHYCADVAAAFAVELALELAAK